MDGDSAVRNPQAVRITFKSRNSSANVRRKRIIDETTAQGAEIHLEETESVREKLVEYQQLKLLKNRGIGIEISNIKSTIPNDSSGIRKKDNKNFMAKQFSSRVDHGVGVNVAHENVMNTYISKKLGLDAESEKQPLRQNPLDELYKVPPSLNVESSGRKETKLVRIRDSEEGLADSWSTGIAEVALPEVFRQRNVVETETAAIKRREEEETRMKLLHQQQDSEAYHRFQLPDEALDSLKHILPVEASEVVSTQLSGKRKYDDGHSTDDLVMKKFRQQQQHYNRSR